MYVQILSTGVQQVHAVRGNGSIGDVTGLVVDDCPIRPKPRYTGEAQALVVLLLTESKKCFEHLHFAC